MTSEGPPPARRYEVVLTDPRALRALAHPARRVVVDELYAGHERTASELGALTGLTASAMSYHLRALHRWGVVEPGAPRTDGRERPWRASARNLRWDERAGGGHPALVDALTALYLDRLRDDLARWARADDDGDAGWRPFAGVSRGFPWLTVDEARSLADEVHAAVERRARGRDAIEHPPDTRQVAYFFALVPTDDDPA